MFLSKARLLGQIKLPIPSGIQIQMMPIVLHDKHSIPTRLNKWNKTLCKLMDLIPDEGIGYLTIDEQKVEKNHSHRRPGLHIDGMGAWGQAKWAGRGGMICVSNEAACNLYPGEFEGEPLIGRPEIEGSCEHLRSQCRQTILQKTNNIYWLDGHCVHESLPLLTSTVRQFLRISTPSNSQPYQGFAKNPEGVELVNLLPERKLSSEYSYRLPIY